MDPLDTTYILVTGANSGLGLGICQRLINDFLDTRPSSKSLHIIVTTRSATKGFDTIAILQQTANRHNALRRSSLDKRAERIILQSELVDLSSLLSVRKLAQKLLASGLPRIDVVILNAGILGIAGINIPLAAWRVGKDWVHELTFPSYYIATVGAIAEPQFPKLPSDAPKTLQNEPPLAETFLSNVLGHYILTHELMALLRTPTTSPNGAARIIWVSSSTAVDKLDFSDLQGFQAHAVYENSKRITDLLAISATLPLTSDIARTYFTPEPKRLLGNGHASRMNPTPSPTQDPQFLVCHPGVLTTNIVVLPFPLPYLWLAVLWIARILGSPWHTLKAYTAASAPVFLSLISPAELSELHSPSGFEGGGIGKWGSTAIGLGGTNGVKRTFVPGWGLGGSTDDGPQWNSLGFGNKQLGTKDLYSRRTGRHRDFVKPTKEDLKRFEEDGREVWIQLEKLRTEWTERCEIYETFVAREGNGQVKN